MTDDERKRFLAQFDEARRELASLAKLFPACFDKAGRPIVAELRLIPTSHQR